MAAASSSIDKPLLKVSRPVAACSRCRTAKIKCDGKLPACSACERAGKANSCSGATDEFAKGKERSYVSSLEAQCERLEKRIQEVRQQQHDPAYTTGATTSSPLMGSGARAHQKEASDIDDLVGDFGFLSVNATSRDFHGFTSTTSFARLTLTVSSAKSLPQAGSKALLTRHEAVPLIQYYFDNVYILLPFFVETSFWTSVDAVYQDSGRFANSFDHWIVRMVLAIAAAAASQRRSNSNNQVAQRLVSAALEYSEDVLHPGSIAGIQAILLLLQYALVDPEHFRSWYLIGTASRVLVDLGLHQEPPPEVYKNSTRLDLRRRVFYCVYSLDRQISMASERSFSFTDDSVNVCLPSLPQTSNNPTLSWQNHVFLRSLEPAVHLFNMRRLQSECYQEMYYSGRTPSPEASTATWVFCDKARKWLENAPRGTPHYFAVLYELEFLYSLVVALSPCHRSPIIGELNKALIFKYATDFIARFHQIVQNPSWLPFMTYMDMKRVHVIGKRFLEILDGSYNQILGGIIPEIPSVSPETPEPPSISPQDRTDCVRRAITCLDNISVIFEYAYQKWNVRELLDSFEQESRYMKSKLSQTREQQQQQQERHHQHQQQQVAAAYFTNQAQPFVPTSTQNAALQQAPDGSFINTSLAPGNPGNGTTSQY